MTPSEQSDLDASDIAKTGRGALERVYAVRQVAPEILKMLMPNYPQEAGPSTLDRAVCWPSN